MSNKVILKLGIAFSLSGIFLGYIFSNSRYFTLCFNEDPICRLLFDRVGDPMFLGSFSLLLILTILFAVPNTTFRTWLWFGAWYVPLGALVLIFYPEPGGGTLNLNPSVEQVTQYVCVTFIVVSLIIIISEIVFRALRK